jgi:cyclopropane fatty-acyl-phospholipid synthase-like methyltransferase
VGPAYRFDTIAAQQFNLLTLGGLRERHTLLDIGCGSLRAGRLFLTYLQPGNYYGLEPEKWVLEEGIREMLGQEIIALRRPTFSHDRNFTLTEFGRDFDYLLAQSIFSHTSVAQLHRCFAQAREVVGPRSKFFATFIPGDADYDGDEWVYPGIVRFRPETMRSIAAEHGFTMRMLEWPHPSQHWALFRPTEAPKKRLPPALRPHESRIARLEARVAKQKAELKTLRAKQGKAK